MARPTPPTIAAAVERRRSELHGRLQDAVEAVVPDFRFTDPEADERAQILRDAIIDAEIEALRSGTVPSLDFMADLGAMMARAGLPLDHHYAAHRVSYPILLDVVLEEADRVGASAELCRTLARRHHEYTTATTEAYVSAYVEARQLTSLEEQGATRRFIEAISGSVDAWSPNLRRVASSFGLDPDTPCFAVLITWADLPADITPELLQRRITAWLSLADVTPILAAGSSVVGLVMASADQDHRVRETLRRAAAELGRDGVTHPRMGVSACRPARFAVELFEQAGVAHAATTEAVPCRLLRDVGALDYLVTVSPPSTTLLTSDGARRLHAETDAASPTCREVLDCWVEHDGELRATAAALHCHPNTVLNRFRRMRELSGLDPRAPAGLVRLVVDLALLDHHERPPDEIAGDIEERRADGGDR